MRLIIADLLIKEVDKSKYNNPHTNGAVRINHIKEHDHFLRMILDAPTAEAEPAVHAEWEPHPMVPGFVRCSACRDCITYDEWPDGQKWKRCPECGAHMDKVAAHG